MLVACYVDKGRYRKFGKIYDGKIHFGHDYDCAYRTFVYSPIVGKVIFCERVNGFGGSQPNRKGWMVCIEGNGLLKQKYTLLYGHVIPSQKIKIGYIVSAGEKIGEVDKYYIGDEEFNHLHLGCWRGGGLPDIDDKNSYGYGELLRNWIDPIFAQDVLL